MSPSWFLHRFFQFGFGLDFSSWPNVTLSLLIYLRLGIFAWLLGKTWVPTWNQCRDMLSWPLPTPSHLLMTLPPTRPHTSPPVLNFNQTSTVNEQFAPPHSRFLSTATKIPNLLLKRSMTRGIWRSKHRKPSSMALWAMFETDMGNVLTAGPNQLSWPTTCAGTSTWPKLPGRIWLWGLLRREATGHGFFWNGPCSTLSTSFGCPTVPPVAWYPPTGPGGKCFNTECAECSSFFLVIGILELWWLSSPCWSLVFFAQYPCSTKHCALRAFWGLGSLGLDIKTYMCHCPWNLNLCNCLAFWSLTLIRLPVLASSKKAPLLRGMCVKHLTRCKTCAWSFLISISSRGHWWDRH